MRALLIITMLLACPLLEAATVNLSNDREGESFYTSKAVSKSITRLLSKVSASEIKEAYTAALNSLVADKLCSFDLNQKLLERLPPAVDLPAVIHYLRSQNKIDDSVTKILLQAQEVEGRILEEQEEASFLSRGEAKVENLLALIGNFEKKNQKNCFDEAYKSLYSDLLKEDKQLRTLEIQALFREALKDQMISARLYTRLESARISAVQTWPLSLKTYSKKISSLRIQYPLKDLEKSKFVTEKVKKQKLSRRQRLLENYSDLQIVLMGNVIQKLRTRLESQKMEILVYSKDETTSETITLNPMDRFCFCIVKLREEMAVLATNSYFGGRGVDYMDLVTAAFETGIIPAIEIDTVGGLQEIWSPNETFMSKAMIWIKSISSVASIAVPPPYGFIPALAMVVIEATTDKQDTNNDPTKLFQCKN